MWAPCVLAGLLLITFAVHTIDRGDPTSTGQAVPLVNVGRLPAAASTPATTPAPSPGRAGGSIPVGSRLRMGRLGLDAPITHVAAVRGVMQIPPDPHTVGWWTAGSAPGDPQGNTVIVGHVNNNGISGALAVLPRMRPGDPLVVSQTGSQHQYRVLAIRSYPKAVGIPAGDFSRSGPARLILITCGGRFDRSTGNYENNIVVYAEPA